MDEDRKKAYQDRLAARIKEWEARIDQLAARARRAEADLRLKLQDEESDLRKRLDEARQRLRSLREASDEGWDEIKAGAEKLWDDLREAWEKSAERAPPPHGGSDHSEAADGRRREPSSAPSTADPQSDRSGESRAGGDAPPREPPAGPSA